MHPFIHILSGVLLCNAVPHLANGLQGRAFPTPFAKPHGVGPSPAWLNFVWGTANLTAGALLLGRYPVELGFSGNFLTFLAGFLLAGTYLSVHFAKVARKDKDKL